MVKIKVEAGDWVVVCDGRKALFLENIGDEVFPNLHIKETHEHSESRTRAPMRLVVFTNPSVPPAALSSRPTGMTRKSGRS